MARTPRQHFEREREKCGAISDDAVADALSQFAAALDPETPRPAVPKPRPDGSITQESKSNNTAGNYLQVLRLAHERGCDLLGVDAAGFNDFMNELVEGNLDTYEGDLSKSSAKSWQSAARAFYRFCTEPGRDADRPDVGVEWPADGIIMFTERSTPKHDEGDILTDREVDALREACLKGMNPRRDRAFLELLAGTGQRRYAIITLRVRDITLDEDPPYILLNPAIEGDGDKGAIEKTGRWKPIVSDPSPVREWVHNHPLRDPDVREDHGAPADFDDCYLFVGDPGNGNSDLSDHWDGGAAEQMLKRLRTRTEGIPGVQTVRKPVDPHNFRHWAYTRSKDLDIDESKRRKVFGWSEGSTTGEKTYGHIGGQKAGEELAEKWADTFGDTGTEGVAEQIVGRAVAGDLSPEARMALVQELLGDDEAKSELAEGVVDAME